MNKKLVFQYLLLTFSIMIFLWGLLLIFGSLGFTINSHFLLYIPWILGGLSPTIASYIALKKNNEITGFGEWIKKLFAFKIPIKFYVFTILLYLIILIMYFLIPPGVERIEPIYVFFVFLPIMIIGGGLEEAGWRYILQPELDKIFGFILSAIIVAPIWAVWHLPLFYIQGVGQYGTNFGIFTIRIIGYTFALGAIQKITGSVFLCILFHSMFNAGLNTFIITQTLSRNIIMSISMVVISIVSVFYIKRKERNPSVNAEGIQL